MCCEQLPGLISHEGYISGAQNGCVSLWPGRGHTCAGHLVPEGALCTALALSLDEEGANMGRIPLVVGRCALHLHQGVAWLCLQQSAHLRQPAPCCASSSGSRLALPATISTPQATCSLLQLTCPDAIVGSCMSAQGFVYAHNAMQTRQPMFDRQQCVRSSMAFRDKG